MHSDDTVDYNGDGVINSPIWDHPDSGDKKATVEDVYYHLTEYYDTEGKYYDLNKNGVIEIDLGEGDRNGDGYVNSNDNTYSEKQTYYWFVKDAEGNFSVVRGDRYGRQLVYNEERGYYDLVKIDGISCLQDLEQTQQYKDAGFNILFIDSSVGLASAISHSEDGENISSTDFYGSLYERIMDYAQEVGLKCFVRVGNIPGWSSRPVSLFESYTSYSTDKNGNTVATVNEAAFSGQEALNAAVAKDLENIATHPAFYGVALVDEPNYKMFTAIGEVVKAITAYGDSIGKEIYIMQNLLPYARDGRTSYNGTNVVSPDTYRDYLEAYYEKAGQYMDMKYVQYDDYPLMCYSNNLTLACYIQTQQITSDFAKDKGIYRSVAIQTYSDTKLDGTPYGRRAVTDTDMLWQTHVNLAMGVKEISYYTLRPIHNTGDGTYESDYPLDRLGNPNELFDSIKKANSYMNVMSAALNSFEYQGLKYYGGTNTVYTDKYSNKYTWDDLMGTDAHNCQVVQNTFANTVGVEIAGDLTATGLVLVTELYDEETGLYGYYVVNASETYYSDTVDNRVKGTVALTFDTSVFDAYQIWTGLGGQNKFMPANGSIAIELDYAEGAFVIPFKR